MANLRSDLWAVETIYIGDPSKTIDVGYTYVDGATNKVQARAVIKRRIKDANAALPRWVRPKKVLRVWNMADDRKIVRRKKA